MQSAADDTVLAELGELNETKHLNIWHRAWYLADSLSGLEGKEPACNAGGARPGFDPWVRKVPWRREWQPTQCSCLENPMDTGAWWAAVPGVANCQPWLSGFTFTLVSGRQYTELLGPLFLGLERLFLYGGPSKDGSWDVESLRAELNKLSFDAMKNTCSVLSLYGSTSSLWASLVPHVKVSRRVARFPDADTELECVSGMCPRPRFSEEGEAFPQPHFHSATHEDLWDRLSSDTYCFSTESFFFLWWFYLFLWWKKFLHILKSYLSYQASIIA